ncbi:DUF305 domain-containing protein [Aequorivita sp. SDUM287046]|uniref:DUF305 domain-containing protein n=1 Tax=Aequorivita aurantiaca TaxID=3053356 RepID=A0ABT8DJM2_9FLAO|nr:DUF305 domain-containing protein [Aequorivita aurantiaca]MDN3724131.1 DUF305 domain-containing protein [Aequorivita aurantiaca]
MKKSHDTSKAYSRFALMLACSFIAMYITMYLNTYAWDHIYFSLTRFYMVCLGISAMAIIMWGFMRPMYKNKMKNRIIIWGSIGLFLVALILVRSQIPVGEVAYMKAMIPHHSIAVLTSKRAKIKDPEVQQLAKEIIEAQEEEIAEMKRYIKRIENKEH